MVNSNSIIFDPVEKELITVSKNMIKIAEKEISYSKKISEILTQILANPGKKIRPRITLLSSKLWGEPENQNNIDIATAVELLHIATLLHDDTVDQAERRRGKETPSSVWGKEVAVLLGDYIFAASAIFVSKTENGTIAMRFANTIVELRDGMIDIDKSKLSFYEHLGGSGNKLRKHYCKECTTPVYSYVAKWDKIYLYAGLLDDISILKKVNNIWYKDSHFPFMEVTENKIKT